MGAFHTTIYEATKSIRPMALMKMNLKVFLLFYFLICSNFERQISYVPFQMCLYIYGYYFDY